MDKRWKALTAPLWAEIMAQHEKMMWFKGYTEYDYQFRYDRRHLRQSVFQPTIQKLLAIRRARLAGECPVYWDLVNK